MANQHTPYEDRHVRKAIVNFDPEIQNPHRLSKADLERWCDVNPFVRRTAQLIADTERETLASARRKVTDEIIDKLNHKFGNDKRSDYDLEDIKSAVMNAGYHGFPFIRSLNQQNP